ncbi:MAG: DUF2723 domain-containing protein [Bacteroidetes bacterium]|jgi:MFS family permease|nr:DUF2723 domain-containing protein [Bacteroidota bacterium]
MKKFNLVNSLVGWLTFLIAAFVYLMTIEPTTSFWDCGEFIASAFKLQVGHPPGAPFFMILGRFFTLFAGGDVEMVPKTINALSALASAFTILFLFWTITHLAGKLIVKNHKATNGQILAIIGSGLVGALAYTFSDTFWFSAVEGEVYASSSLFTALVFWAILKWENNAGKPHANKWLILIAYLIGLSIGVHLLNLLAIPAIVLVYYFKKYKPGRKGVFAALAISGILLVFIMYGIIQGLIKMASKFELLFVNGLGLPFNSGAWLFLLLLTGFIIYGIYLTHKPKEDRHLNTIIYSSAFILMGLPMVGDGAFTFLLVTAGLVSFIYFYAYKEHALMNTILISFAVILIGYSSYAAIIIRSNANPPMDQNNPENVFSLIKYLNRDQYGEHPIFTGHYYNAPVEEYVQGSPQYTPKNGKYEITDYKTDIEYDDQFKTLFPRMYSPDPQHIEAYKAWGDIEGLPVRITGPDGQQKTVQKPTFSENIRFFIKYQVGYMYLRYFLWNFSGRQNDIQGHMKTDVLKGNWLSGIPFIDNPRLGNQEKLPDSLKNNPARNQYYMLPLLLGLIGLFYMYRKSKLDFWIVFTLFILTGLAIVIYLNQTPFQPRERDYAYAGSFYAFSIFIGLGVLGIWELLSKKLNGSASAVATTLLCLLAVPTIMAKENWDDHDRSGRYTARDFAYNYLNSCKENGILMTNGDNDTFPLWYVQEVEGVRTDVRVMNLSYLGTSWYIDQMKRKAYQSDPVPFSLTSDQYIQGTRDIVYLVQRTKGAAELKDAIDWVASDDARTKQLPGYREKLDHLPSKNFKLTIDKEHFTSTGTLDSVYYPEIVDQMNWKINRQYLTKNHLMILDLLADNQWERPVYYAITVSDQNYLNMEKYFLSTGLAYQVVPVESKGERGQKGGVNTNEMYHNLMHVYKWGNIQDSTVYLNENNRRMITNFRNSFSRLAGQLVEENKPDSAHKVLDKCIELMPHERIPYSYFSLTMAESYFRINQADKGIDILTKAHQKAYQEMDYYLNLPPKISDKLEEEKNLALYVLRGTMQLARQFGQKEMATQFDANIQDLVMKTNFNVQ